MLCLSALSGEAVTELEEEELRQMGEAGHMIKHLKLRLAV